MPCYEITTTTVDTAHVPRAILEAALDAVGRRGALHGAGYTLTLDATGNVQVRDTGLRAEEVTSLTNRIKREVASIVLAGAAKKWRWDLKPQANGTIQATKRSF